MKIESSVVGNKRDKVLRHGEKIIRKKVQRRTKRTAHPPLPRAIQTLFYACREVFHGPGTVPLPLDVQKMQLILDKMKPQDFGLTGDINFFKAKNVANGTPRITYTSIYNCDNFSMCIFFLPPSAVIPLHNHPGMTVFSKLLFGSMHIKAYDWVDPVESDETLPFSQSARLARVEMDTVFTAPCKTSILYPAAGGNIHAFTAVTPCVILDVLGPPYSKEDDRDCTYYRDLAYSRSSDPAEEVKEGNVSYGWLEEIEMPKDLKMDGGQYLGPQIFDSIS
ncbi:plant cysteine oxidase 2-like [Tasmannia lanceolata]|uniref:plant cysteine oxidase 2-like n=1 Tax=Tasmannia lanceolata TaxID=3420 RepID=UPI004062F3A3